MLQFNALKPGTDKSLDEIKYCSFRMELNTVDEFQSISPIKKSALVCQNRSFVI